MFNISGGELIIVLLLGLVILGPERLPKAARQVARVMAQVRDLSNSFQRELKDAFDDPGEPVVRPSRPQLTALEGGADRTAAPTPAESTPVDPIAAVPTPVDPIAAVPTPVDPSPPPVSDIGPEAEPPTGTA